jgi:hypothetical protein
MSRRTWGSGNGDRDYQAHQQVRRGLTTKGICMPTTLVDWRAELLDLQEDLMHSHRTSLNGRMGVLVTAVHAQRGQADDCVL